MSFCDVKPGERCVIEYQGVRAGGTLVAGIGQGKYVVRLDGTEQMVTVPGGLIKEGE